MARTKLKRKSDPTAPNTPSAKKSKVKSAKQPLPSSATPATLSKSERRRRKQASLAQSQRAKGGQAGSNSHRNGITGEYDIVDLTVEEGEEEDAVNGTYGDRGAGVDGVGGPGPSTLRSRLSRSPLPPVDNGYVPTAFRPMPRSLLAGMASLRSPSPKQVPVKEYLTALPPKIQDIIENDQDNAHAAPDPGGVSEPTPLSSEHFDPPPLFSANLVPPVPASDKAQGNVHGHSTVLPPESQVAVSKSKAVELLLPSHVEVEEAIPNGERQGNEDGAGMDEPEYRDMGNVSMEGLHFLDTDVAKGVTRYFDPDDAVADGEEAQFLAQANQSKICSNCKLPGHRPKECPHIICTTCGEMDKHERRECPFGVTCYRCGLRGHRLNECPQPASSASRHYGCSTCGDPNHKEQSCPSIWRLYKYRSSAEREVALEERRCLQGWAKEAAGISEHHEICYNCAGDGHLGDDCRMRRGSLARIQTPSAFSYSVSSTGPFFNPKYRSQGDIPKASHQRFDDDADLAGTNPQFGGLEAGRRGKEKARKQAAAIAINDDDEDDLILPPPPLGISIRGAGRMPPGRGIAGARIQTPPNQTGWRIRRPWDSEKYERTTAAEPMSIAGAAGRMPFAHSHLMSANGLDAPATEPRDRGISFGRLSGLPPRLDTPTQSSSHQSRGLDGRQLKRIVDPDATRSPGGKNKASTTMINRALGRLPPSSSAPGSRSRSPVSVSSPLSQPGSANGDEDSPRKRRRRQGNARDKDDDRDWENEWRRSGLQSGGNVRDWGKEEDEFDRQDRRKARKEGKVVKDDGGSRYGIKAARGSLNSRGGGKGGEAKGGKPGPSTPVGQRYRGGY